MVACGDPFVEVVDEIIVDAVLALDGIYDLDAPVVVCRVAIAQIVEMCIRDRLCILTS